MNSMYERIESLCTDRGVNITQMCREAGITRGNLSELKMGRTATLSSKTLLKISAYFDVPMEYLLGTSPQSISADNQSVVLSNTVGDNSVNTPPAAPKLEDLLAEDELEMLRIYRKLSFRQKHNLMNELYRLEDQLISQPTDSLNQRIENAESRAQAPSSRGKQVRNGQER